MSNTRNANHKSSISHTSTQSTTQFLYSSSSLVEEEGKTKAKTKRNRKEEEKGKQKNTKIKGENNQEKVKEDTSSTDSITATTSSSSSIRIPSFFSSSTSSDTTRLDTRRILKYYRRSNRCFSFLNQLADDELILAIQVLDMKSVLQVARSSKRMYNLCQLKQAWKYIPMLQYRIDCNDYNHPDSNNLTSINGNMNQFEIDLNGKLMKHCNISIFYNSSQLNRVESNNSFLTMLQRANFNNLHKFVINGTQSASFWSTLLQCKAVKNIRIIDSFRGYFNPFTMKMISQFPFLHTLSLSNWCFTKDMFSPLKTDWKEKSDMLSSLIQCQSLTVLDWSFDANENSFSQLPYVIKIPNLTELILNAICDR
jgi:hypothetical protein